MDAKAWMISSSVSFMLQSLSVCLAALRSEIAENCSSTSAKRTALRRLSTVCSNERETMSSSLPSMTARPVVASLARRLTSA